MTAYRKTAKGLSEIETRAHRLAPRLRSALIIVDGRRTAAELRPLILQQPEETLRWLLDEGFIEPVPGAASGSAPAAAPAPAAGPATPGAADKPLSPAEFARLRAGAVRLLLEQVGPDAEPLALRMERAANAEALRPLLAMAVQSVSNMRGRQAGQDFAARLSAL
jgi:hypothetical protein